MTKRQFSMLLGLFGQAGCVVYDEPIQRETSDAAMDAARDAPLTQSRDGAEGTPLDASVPDAATSRDVASEPRIGTDGATTADASDVIGQRDASDDARDAPLTDASLGDATTADDALDARLDVVIDVDAADAKGIDAPSIADAPRIDSPTIGCSVDFTVSGVTWEGATEDSGARVVRIVGDNAALGAWVPEAGRVMSEKAPGAWSANLALADRTSIEFKFVKMQAGGEVEWEQWLPLDSNRSMLVDCWAEGGTTWIDAGNDAGPARRAVGRSYGGAFGVRPLDATK